MTREEMECMLLEPNGVERIRELAERMRINQGVLAQPAPAGGTMARAEAPPNIRLASQEEIAANDLSLASLPRVLGLDRFIADLANKSPIEALEVLEGRFRQDPSASNGALLQAGINGLTTSGPLDEASKRVVERAMALFHKKPQRKKKQGGTDDIWYWGYVDANYGGGSTWADLIQGWIYWRTPDFRSFGMNDALSSLIYGCTTEETGGNVILFENINYNGRYRNYSTQPGFSTGVSYVGDDFNDITSSTLIVRRFANETAPVSIGSAVPQSAVTDIVNQQGGVRSAGNTTITWDLWPSGPTTGSDPHPDDPGKRFIYVIVPIMVQTPWYVPDYYAQVRYWIYLYVDTSGNLQGYVNWYGCYVEGGIVHDQVRDGLMAKIPGTLGQVNNLVSQALALANIGAPYRFSYFLPGRNEFNGNTSDDVSVVAVR